MDNFDPYNVLLAIATNIPVLLMTGFVLQCHIYTFMWFSFMRCAAIMIVWIGLPIFYSKCRGEQKSYWESDCLWPTGSWRWCTLCCQCKCTNWIQYRGTSNSVHRNRCVHAYFFWCASEVVFLNCQLYQVPKLFHKNVIATKVTL